LVVRKLLFNRKLAEAVDTAQYTAPPLTRAIIDLFTVTNVSGSLAYITVNIVPLGGFLANSNKVLQTFPIAAGDTVICHSLSGQIVEAGSYISTLANAAMALVLSVNGREIS
jgi:hypothetical protein